MKKHHNLPKSLRVYIRREKAQIKRRLVASDDYKRAVKELYSRIGGRPA